MVITIHKNISTMIVSVGAELLLSMWPFYVLCYFQSSPITDGVVSGLHSLQDDIKLGNFIVNIISLIITNQRFFFKSFPNELWFKIHSDAEYQEV